MRSPVSTRRGQGVCCGVVEESLECVVLGGVVGGLGLPEVPDDVEPGAGEDADGVGVVCAFTEGALDPRTPLRDGDRVVVDGRCEGYDAATGVRMTECRLASGRRGDKGAMGAP